MCWAVCVLFYARRAGRRLAARRTRPTLHTHPPKQHPNSYAESGQVLVDRAAHLDALEWTWWLNSFSEPGGKGGP